MAEPRIPEHDWNIIEHRYRRWCEEKGFRCLIPTFKELEGARGQQIPGTNLLTKDEIREILIMCQQHDPVDDGYLPIVDKHGNDIPEGKRTPFVKKYFEKWLTIRYKFSGVQSTFFECPSWVYTEMRIIFQRLVPIFFRRVQGNMRKKAFPNYNYVISRILDLLNMNHARRDFPMPRTKNKRRNLNEVWKAFCKDLQWPYINSDDLEFPLNGPKFR